MTNKLYFYFFTLVVFLISCHSKSEREYIDLQGIWKFKLDSLDVGENETWYVEEFSDEVKLPGTTDTNKKGFLNYDSEETTFLSREFFYKGKAWYQRDVYIPKGWDEKTFKLILERTKPTKVWIDDLFIGSSRNISTEQSYDLTGKLSPGKHTITVMVDNGQSIPEQILTSSHAYTESTQTNWNGIIGDMRIEVMPNFNIKDIQIYPDAKSKSARVKILLNRPNNNIQTATIKLFADACNTSRKHSIKVIEQLNSNNNEVEVLMEMGKDAVLWDEFEPAFYSLTVLLEGKGFKDVSKATFGLRDFTVEGTQFAINDRITFLRGKHDACVFPLTAHVAMDVDSWKDYFKTAKSYGINHYRFHSWCPPKACFEAANIEGIYLQPELPYWGSFNREDTALIRFLKEEGVNIQLAYGNNPSFVMFALGNELGGDQEVMTEMVKSFKNVDNRHLYATGSNNYLGFLKEAKIDDYFTTCRVGAEETNDYNTHTRGSFSFADANDGGLINHTYPNSILNFDKAVSLCPVPIISHETGQFQIYPNYKEMEKYTGVLKPRNFEIFKNRIEKAGMLNQTDKFFEASGKWSTLLYKADIEMDLRTRGFGGFQLLDLQDYPGQGSAFVGILDAFMDSKGLITPEEWREFCSEVVPLFSIPKFCYSNDEVLKGEVLIANYSKYLFENNIIKWTLSDESSETVDQGDFSFSTNKSGLFTIGEIKSNLSSITRASKLLLTLSVKDTKYRNSYSIWVYPSEIEFEAPDEVLISRKLNKETKDVLAQGGKVLWFPDHKEYEEVTVGGLFQTDYWNYRMFKTISERLNKPVSPGTLGLLTDPEHPVFNDFPTDFHTNWQWFSMIKHSRPFILDKAPNNYIPIIQVIDNIERNHKLGFLFEFNIDGGKLLVCMSNLPEIIDYPEARQLYYSILSYVISDNFKPKNKLSYDNLKNLFSDYHSNREIEFLDNISY